MLRMCPMHLDTVSQAVCCVNVDIVRNPDVTQDDRLYLCRQHRNTLVFAEFLGIQVVMCPPIASTSNNFKKIFGDMLTEKYLEG